MELRHLRYYVAVAEEENVSRGAMKLHVSQPALSRQIRDLEDELGLQLLQRSAKSVRLTEAGRAFLIEAKAILQRVDEGVEAARTVARGEQGELNIGYAPSLTSRFLSPTLRAFQAELPKVRVRLHDLSTEEMLAGVREGELQMALVVRASAASLRGLRFEEVAREPICLAVARKHRLARRRSVSVTQAAVEPLIAYSRAAYPEYHELLATVFSGIKLRPHIAEEHDSVIGLITAVEAGTGVALAPTSLSCIAGRRLKLMPLSPAPEPLVVGAVCATGEPAVGVARFLTLARTAASRL
jgi:DNA-binding transcriptional LysR family regulator